MIGKTISHYKILEKLGAGGMGVVYKAEDTKLKRTVALKFLPPELTRDPEAKQRFIQEAQSASTLDHQNICTVHEIDEAEDGQTYIVMACYEGETLKDKIKDQRLKIKEAVDIAGQIALGLAKAHAQGIVHRDIKPANIFITSEGVVKILDFGLAKLAGPTQLTKTGATVGTVSYMSPEQAKGEKVDHRTDIWSLGVVLYEMVTGQLPSKGEYDQAVVYSILNEEPILPSSIRKEIPNQLEQIVVKALEKDPEIRYQSMEEVLEELKKPLISLSEPGQKEKSIIVLPFVNMSPDPDQEYFSDGLTEEIITDLSHIQDLLVISRNSAMTFKGTKKKTGAIAGEVNVRYVLEGSVRKAGNNLRITAQLIDADNDSHLWAEKYSGTLDDVFDIQETVSRSIADALKLKLLKSEEALIVKHTTENIEAYNYYMEGRYCLNKNTDEWIRKAITHFEKAIQEDVNYAAAYAGLAESYIHFYGGIGIYAAKDNIPKARETAHKALDLDPELAEAHVAMGMIALYYDWDRTKMKKCFTKAIELNPNYVKSYIWYATYFIYFEKDYVRALDMIKMALELDPLDLLLKVVKLNIYTWQKKFDEALEYCQTLINLEPNYPMGHYFLGLIQGAMGQYDKAISKLLEAIKLGGRSINHIGVLGYIYARADQEAKARKLLDEIIQRVEQGSASSSWVARVYAGLGDTAKVFEWLEKAYEERDMSLIYINCEYEFEEVRSDPRFNVLLKKIGLIT